MVNNVRGPSSALTEFLREEGITAAFITRRARQQEETPAEPGASASTSGQNGVQESEAVNDENGSPRKKARMSRAELAKKKALAKAKGKKKGADEDEDDDEYSALSKSIYSSGKPPVGSFEDCAECSKQFTVTRYTMAAVSKPGFLCHECAKLSGADPFKKPAPPRKRKVAEKQNGKQDDWNPNIPSLTTLCVEVICQHINDIEALGDIGPLNKATIARFMTKNRMWTPENAQILYSADNRILTLFDVTELTPAALCTLADLNPFLFELRLDYCGRIESSTMVHWAPRLPNLTRLELLGPFLVRPDGWVAFFESHPQLKGFLITQSPRFDLPCMESLASNCPNLTELRLSQIGKLDDNFLQHITTFKSLTFLEISEPSMPISTRALITLIENIGSSLTNLVLTQIEGVNDDFLVQGLRPHAHSLNAINLTSLPGLTNRGIVGLFSDWPCNQLERIILRRNHDLSDDSLGAIIKHSGQTLRELDINGWKDTTTAALNNIGKGIPNLEVLDVSWCRDMDDFAVKALHEGCPSLREVLVYGCNRLTNSCPRKRGVTISGLEVPKDLPRTSANLDSDRPSPSPMEA